MEDRRGTGAQRVALISALAAVALLLAGGRLVALHLEEANIHGIAPLDFPLKNQGIAFQKAAALTPDIILVYGSSEMVQEGPATVGAAFSHEPTGFQACPIGAAGTTPLVMVQKIAALGPVLRDRKIAISLSPAWFLKPEVNSPLYTGNFSVYPACRMLFGPALSFTEKSRIAQRMLQFPATFQNHPLLDLALHRYASAGLLDRVVLASLAPLAILHNIIHDLQDHFEALSFILHRAKQLRTGDLAAVRRPNHAATDNDGATVDRRALRQTAPPLAPPVFRDDASFLERLNSAREWGDLELLLGALKKLKVKPLFLSMPFDGSYYDQFGISRAARQVYYNRLAQLARQYQVQLVDFDDHDRDPEFLVAHRDHLAAKGWLCFNRALDDYFHDRLPRKRSYYR